MSECVGLPLNSLKGSCQVHLLFENAYKDFKLIIEPNPRKKVLRISGYIPTEIAQRYGKFEEVYIVNERVEKKFMLSTNDIHEYLYITPEEFELQPDIALGNVLRVYGRKGVQNFLFGDCFIVHEDPNFNDIDYLNKVYQDSKEKQKEGFFGEIFLVLKLLVGTIIVIVLLVLGWNYYSKVKRESFEGMVSSRKEGFQYTDTAKVLSARLSTRQATSTRQILPNNLTKQIEKTTPSKMKEMEMKKIIKEDELNENDPDELTTP